MRGAKYFEGTRTVFEMLLEKLTAWRSEGSRCSEVCGEQWWREGVHSSSKTKAPCMRSAAPVTLPLQEVHPTHTYTRAHTRALLMHKTFCVNSFIALTMSKVDVY